MTNLHLKLLLYSYSPEVFYRDYQKKCRFHENENFKGSEVVTNCHGLKLEASEGSCDIKLEGQIKSEQQKVYEEGRY